jgi:hypothetical protein
MCVDGKRYGQRYRLSFQLEFSGRVSLGTSLVNMSQDIYRTDSEGCSVATIARPTVLSLCQWKNHSLVIGIRGEIHTLPGQAVCRQVASHLGAYLPSSLGVP